MLPGIKFHKITTGGFRINHGIGQLGQEMIVKIDKPVNRKEHTNIFAVISGSVSCIGPEPYGVKVFEAGMIGEDLPPYTEVGDYHFQPGPNGVEFFCVTTHPVSNNHEFIKISKRTNSKYTVPQGHLLLVVSGSVNEVKGPLLVDASKTAKDIRITKAIKALEIWAKDK